ncbi:ZrgA family zinc uptake protein [Leucothrix mucor]|uniref:ZrgA family zinc uptake protein n=1 Tax=Leucothrix mucor TaxID=45248 RepID=UPI0003B40678|nr:DUF2796 domain-containing protein [Leucothrix mucor]
MKLSAASIKTTLATSALSSLLLCNSAMAESHTGHTEHAAHEHGAARLTIATTDAGMEITLESPAANIFGFEHLASDEADHKTIHQAVNKLKAGDTLLIADSSAACTLASVDIESAQVDAHSKEKHGDGEHDAHHDAHEAHDEHHDDDKHNDHDDHSDEKHADHDEHHDDHADEKHDDHESDHAESAHNDVDVTWNFSCENPAKLTQVDVRLFSAFPKGFEDVDVDWISTSQAGHLELNNDGIVLLSQ